MQNSDLKEKLMPVFPNYFERYAANNNGVITWLFDQDDISDYGVCASICAHWIRYHSDDRHLATELTRKERGLFNKSRFNKAEVRRIVNLQLSRLGKREDVTGIISQAMDLQNWLEIFGLRLLFHPVTHRVLFNCKEYMDELTAKDSFTQSHLMVNALLNYTSCYVLIAVHNFDVTNLSLDNPGMGHFLCAWLGDAQSDVVFFEPSSGEVWFERRSDFAKFARDYFGEAMVLHKCTEWELYPLAKPALVQGFEMVDAPV